MTELFMLKIMVISPDVSKCTADFLVPNMVIPALSLSLSLQEYLPRKIRHAFLFVDLVVLFCQNPISSPRLNFRRIYGSNNSLQRRKVNYPSETQTRFTNGVQPNGA